MKDLTQWGDKKAHPPAEVQKVPEPANLVRRKYLSDDHLTENIYQYSIMKS